MVERLKPGQELFQAIEEIVVRHNIEAGTIVSLVGSVNEAALRFSDSPDATVVAGPLEIVSVTGTVAKSSCHIHLAVADKEGTTYGGHLMHGSTVYTTVELIIIDLSTSHTFSRQYCSLSGYEELTVQLKEQSEKED